jgi:small nuclear ribonucleoprotein (snRNP)-like protein
VLVAQLISFDLHTFLVVFSVIKYNSSLSKQSSHATSEMPGKTDKTDVDNLKLERWQDNYPVTTTSQSSVFYINP